MRRTRRTAAILLGITTTAVLSVPSLTLADGHHGCSTRSAAGSYGYVITGTRIGVGPAASVGVLTFDEVGNVEGTQTASFNGTIATETIAGTYTIDDDCRGSMSVTVTSSIPAFNRISTVALVWEDDSNAVHAIFTNTGTILTADARRLFRRDD